MPGARLELDLAIHDVNGSIDMMIPTIPHKASDTVIAETCFTVYNALIYSEARAQTGAYTKAGGRTGTGSPPCTRRRDVPTRVWKALLKALLPTRGLPKALFSQGRPPPSSPIMDDPGFGAIPCTSSARAFACCPLLDIEVLPVTTGELPWGAPLAGIRPDAPSAAFAIALSLATNLVVAGVAVTCAAAVSLGSGSSSSSSVWSDSGLLASS
ncbi:MAG: hypothetical protein FRX49_11537 [Trebouxia sp. A1-2]|nr:MAG: hypothetical protein FRX49_11537 [Trebouxia sp. A1-2]